MFNSTSHSFAALTREISSLTLEDKIHITRGHVISSIYLSFKNVLLQYQEKNNSSDVRSVDEYSFVTPQTVGGERVQYYFEKQIAKRNCRI